MRNFLLLLVLIFVGSSEQKLFAADDSSRILQNLIKYDSVKIKQQTHDRIYDLYPEVFYFSPYHALSEQNITERLKKLGNTVKEKLVKRRSTDTTFRGKPKTIQVNQIN